MIWLPIYQPCSIWCENRASIFQNTSNIFDKTGTAHGAQRSLWKVDHNAWLCGARRLLAVRPRHRTTSTIDRDVAKWGNAGVADCDNVRIIVPHNVLWCSISLFRLLHVCPRLRARPHLVADSMSFNKVHDPVFCQRRCHLSSHWITRLLHSSPFFLYTRLSGHSLIMSPFAESPFLSTEYVLLLCGMYHEWFVVVCLSVL